MMWVFWNFMMWVSWNFMMWVSWNFMMWVSWNFMMWELKCDDLEKPKELEAELAGYEAESSRKEAELPGH